MTLSRFTRPAQIRTVSSADREADEDHLRILSTPYQYLENAPVASAKTAHSDELLRRHRRPLTGHCTEQNLFGQDANEAASLRDNCKRLTMVLNHCVGRFT